MTTKPTKPIADGCPSWAIQELQKLYTLEVALGNIPSSPEWRSNFVTEVQDRVFSNIDMHSTNEATELVFDRLVRRLAGENFTPEQIMGFINNRVGYASGPKYCTLAEVQAAIPT